jgi:Gpi18-like mannosyltransferase
MEVVTLLRAGHIGFNSRTLKYCAFGLLFLLALVLRLLLYKSINYDYVYYISPWYDHIKSNGGFAALKDNFYNYNPPYLYLIALVTYLPIPEMLALKGISIVFDFVLAFFTYLIIHLKYKRSTAACIGALVLLFAPTIVLNSAVWGQCDAIYTAFCLGCLFFLLKDRGGWACAFFSLAISFKLQAIFVLPVLLIVLIKRKTALKDYLKYLLLILAIFFVLLIPTLIAGRSLGSILSVYPAQIATGGVGTDIPGAPVVNASQAANVFLPTNLTYDAPSFYQWLPVAPGMYWMYAGILLAGLMVLLVSILVWTSKIALTPAIIVKIAFVLVLAIPFLLPRMHERYFYVADVVSIIYAFYTPRFYYIAIMVQICSFSSYVPFLYHVLLFDLRVIAGVVLVVVLITLADLVVTLFPDLLDKLKGRFATDLAQRAPQQQPRD